MRMFKKKRWNKYNIAPKEQRTYNGIVFDSKAEMIYYVNLILEQKYGKSIESIDRQVPFHLGCPENKYVADFVVTYRGGNKLAIDVKGVETAVFRKNLKLWKAYGPMPLRVVKRKGRTHNFEVTREVEGKP